MAKKANVVKETVNKTVNVEKVEEKKQEGRISIMPNMDNTDMWLFVSEQILSQRVRTEGVEAAFKKVREAATDEEKFRIIYAFTIKQMNVYENRLQALKPIRDIAAYQAERLSKKEG